MQRGSHPTRLLSAIVACLSAHRVSGKGFGKNRYLFKVRLQKPMILEL
jgi:hypothetical protein